MNVPEEVKEDLPEIVAETQPYEPGPSKPAGAKKKLPPLWRNRDYMLLWSGQVVSVMGGGISGIVFPLLVLALTDGNYAAAGVAGALSGLPYLIFSLPVGALIDRWNRKQVMILCDLGRALSAASIPIALYFDVLTVWQLFANAFIEGTLFVFFNIAEVASLTRVVDKEQLPQATAQNEAGFIATGLVGPPLGGFLFQISRAIPFVFDAISYLASVISLLFIKTNFQGERTKSSDRNLRREIGEGLKWLWGNKLIRYMAFLTGGSNFTTAGLGLIIIVLAQNLLGVKSANIGEMGPELGWIFSIGSIGGIVGSILGGQIQKRFRFGQVIIATMWVQAILFPLFAFAPHVIVLGVLSALLFTSSPIYNVVQFSYRISIIPEELQGRVNSTFRLLAFGFQPIGSALCGILLQWLGVLPTLGFYSAVSLLLALMTTVNNHVRNARPLTEANANPA